jgi:peptide-methionine (S)-S-oxide reductase
VVAVVAMLAGCTPANGPTQPAGSQNAGKTGGTSSVQTSSSAPQQSGAGTTTGSTGTGRGANPGGVTIAAGNENKEGSKMQQEIATFGAGCFWGVEATFRLIPGVTNAACGYSGGKTLNPTYKQVCTEETGHAEVVQVTFDPAKVSYETIVDTFFRMHDPTQLNRQGPDIGTQYRSVIFYHSPEQAKVAEAVKTRRGSMPKYKKPIVTTIEPAQTFYRAEEYHQEYFTKNGLENHCHLPQPD